MNVDQVTYDVIMMILGALIAVMIVEAFVWGARAAAQRRARRRHWAKRMAEAKAALEEAHAARIRAEESRRRTDEILTRSAQLLGLPGPEVFYEPPAEDDKTH